MKSSYLADLGPEVLQRYYEQIALEVEADKKCIKAGLGALCGDLSREYARALEAEMTIRQIPFKRIEWPDQLSHEVGPS